MFQELIPGTVTCTGGPDGPGVSGWQEKALAVVEHSDARMPVIALEVLCANGRFATLYEGNPWLAGLELMVPPILRLTKRTEVGVMSPRLGLRADAEGKPGA